MNLSREGAMELIGHEAIVQTKYRDSVGVWTIGVGHTKAAGPPDPATFAGAMSLEEVFDLFFKDVQKYVDAVHAAVHQVIAQQQFDALVSFHYNTGAIKRASLVQRLNAGDMAGAAAGFMAYVKPKEVIARRSKEKHLFETGEYSEAGKALVVPATPNGSLQWKLAKRINLREAIS